MEYLGEAVENFVETFSCTEEASSRLPERIRPVAHGNLLAASPNYGCSFAAAGSSISIYTHASICNGDAQPIAVVDLKEGDVTSIHSLALGPHDTVLAHVTISSKRFVIILNISALAAGKIHALAGPSREASAFAVGFSGLNEPNETSYVLATVEEGCVQLHSLNAEGSMPSAKINISNPICVAVSPDSCLLAGGTERGSVVVYDTKTGSTLTTVVEVESGWVPFAVHFADNRAILASYNCDAEVRHVVWHLSSDGTAVSGHSALGEICLASLSFDSDDEDDSDEVASTPTITCISLYEWAICVIGSSKSGDVEIIKKTDNGWEVWKFDEGKSPTLPNDDNDDDTCCVGLAFDMNNTTPIPGPDAASPNINPMPRVIVYTSDSVLLPFALIDGTPGIKCDAIMPASELPQVPKKLGAIQTALMSRGYDQTQPEKRKKTSTSIFSRGTRSQPQNYNKPLLPTQTEQVQSKSSGSETSATETFREPKFEESTSAEIPKSDASRTSKAARSLKLSSFENGPNSAYDQNGVRSFLGNFSFSETSKADPISTAIKPTPIAREVNLPVTQPETTIVSSDFQKRDLLLAPSLQMAEAEASRGDLLGLLKSIMTEMSEELKVSAEAERLVSHEISSQKTGIVSSITETRKQLSKLLEETRARFRNEADLRTTVSKTLSKVLAMSREYEKISLEFRVREADGFSRSLRAEEKEIDEKINRKETEVMRSITAIEDRLNAVTKFQTRRTSPAEVVQQVYSSLSLQGIRIKRIRSLLTALKERMDNQDKGGRLSHLGLSLARLETLNIHDEDVPAHSQSSDGGRKRLSGGRETAVTRSNLANESEAFASSTHGDDTHLLSADVRGVMRRLAMSGGRASITTTVPLVRSKQDQRTALRRANVASNLGEASTVNLRDNAAMAMSQPPQMLATSLPAPKTSAYRSSKPLSTVTVRRPHESETLRLDHDGHSQITAPSVPLMSNSSSSQITAKAGGKPPNTMPSKRPPSHPLFATSVQSTTTPGFLSKSHQRVFGTQTKNGVHSDKQSPSPANPISVKPSPGLEKPRNSGAIPFADLPPDDDLPQQTHDNKSAPAVEKSERSRPVPFAGLPPDEEFLQQKQDIKSAPAVEKPEKSSPIPFAGLPPDEDFLQQKQESTSQPRFEKSEKSRPVPFAGLPPDEDFPQEKQDITSTPRLEKSKRSCPVPFAGLPADDGLPEEKSSTDTLSNQASGQHVVSHSQRKDKTPKGESPSGFFAALPPDFAEEPAQEISKERGKTESALSLRPQEQKDRTPLSGLFAALPSDSDGANDSKNSGTDDSKRGEGAFLYGGSKAGSSNLVSQPPPKPGSAFGTNDLFATLPPEGNGKEPARPLTAFGTGSLIGNNLSKNVIGQAEGSQVDAAVAGNKVGSHSVDRSTSSLFGDGTSTTLMSSTKESTFGTSFETSQQQSSAPFGKASLFGANSSAQQSVPDMTRPQISLSMDAASTDDSDEEPARFGGGMDTSSGAGGVFGASSYAQESKHPFAFGAALSDGTQTIGMTQPGVSSFASFGSSQPFGQSSPSQSSSQTGFGSFAGSQSAFASSFPTSQPAFGETSGFGAASATPAFGMQSSFGAPSQLGTPSSFGTPSQLGATSAPFGSPNASFGGGMTEAKFGESSFGMTSSLGGFTQNSSGSGFTQNSSGSGFGNSFAPSGASPFAQAAGNSGFGGASGGGSGFAALAGSQSGSLIFGNESGPPAFTSAAFSQRRA